MGTHLLVAGGGLSMTMSGLREASDELQQFCWVEDELRNALVFDAATAAKVLGLRELNNPRLARSANQRAWQFLACPFIEFPVLYVATCTISLVCFCCQIGSVAT